MGASPSSSTNVCVMDRKTMIMNNCLKRQPDYEGYQHAYRIKEGVDSVLPSASNKVQEHLKAAARKAPQFCKGGENSFVFMEETMLPRVLEFLFGGALVQCFEVCPLWYVIFYKTLDLMFARIDEGFKKFYGPSLTLEYARTDWSPIHVASSGMRIDRILIVRVNEPHANWCSKVSYSYGYKSNRENNNEDQPQRNFECAFKFDTYHRGRSRSLWIHKDICRFHGDETRVAATQNITPVCVDDRIEIPINVYSAMGLIDLNMFIWHKLEVSQMRKRECPIEQELFDWYDIDTFQSQSVERLQVPDFFGPQLVHGTTEYAGIDVAVSRTRLRARIRGIVPQADRILGSRYEVLPTGSPIILPLKRTGLQHDRFTKIQLRQGDEIHLYISQGGKMT